MILNFGCEGISDTDILSTNAQQTTTYDKTPLVVLLLSSAYNSVGPQTLVTSYLKQLTAYGLEPTSVYVEFLDMSEMMYRAYLIQVFKH
jgi:hypothetical protein